MGWQRRSNQGSLWPTALPAHRGRGRTTSAPAQNAGKLQQPVGDAAQGAAVGLAIRPQGLVAAAALRVVHDGHAGPVEHRLAQPDLRGVAHDDDAGLAAALGTAATPERVRRAA